MALILAVANITISQSPNILGFTLSDFVASVALIISIFTFYFGFSQTSKSEQVKIARELMDRINAKTQKLNEINLSRVGTHNGVEEDARVSAAGASQVLSAVNDLVPEFDYFIHLFKLHVIRDKDIVKFHVHALLDGVHAAIRYLDVLKTRGINMGTATPPDVDGYLSIWKGLEDKLSSWK